MITNQEIRQIEVAGYWRGFTAGFFATITVIAIGLTVIYLQIK